MPKDYINIVVVPNKSEIISTNGFNYAFLVFGPAGLKLISAK